MRQVFSTLIALIHIGRLAEQVKNLAILMLRKQLAMMEQQLTKSVRLSQAKRLTPAAIAVKLKSISGAHSMRLSFQAKTSYTIWR